jgi:hypothetical protein
MVFELWASSISTNAKHWDLQELGRDRAEDGLCAFQLIAQPLRIAEAVSSRVHPVAIK